MLTKSIATGDYVFFFPEDKAFTVPEAGVSSKTAKPGAADEGWVGLGNVETNDPQQMGEKEEEVWGPTGQKGVLSLREIITTKQGLEFKITVNEVSPLAMQCFYRTEELDADSEQFNPLSAVPPNGWLKIQRFDQKGGAHLVMDVWCRLKCTGGHKSGDGSLIRPEFSAVVSYSTLNVASLDT